MTLGSYTNNADLFKYYIPFLGVLERTQFAENNAESCGTVPTERAVQNQNNANSEAQPYYEYVKLWHHKCCGISLRYWLWQKSMFMFIKTNLYVYNFCSLVCASS